MFGQPRSQERPLGTRLMFGLLWQPSSVRMGYAWSYFAKKIRDCSQSIESRGLY